MKYSGYVVGIALSTRPQCVTMAFRLVLHFLHVISLLLEKLFTTEMNIYHQKLSWAFGPCHVEILESCRSDQIKFYLYTNHAESPTLLQLEDRHPPENFNPHAETKILIHGYAGSLEFNGTALMRQAYLEQSSYNIIVVDWGRLVRLPCYPAAVLNTWQAGKCTAEIIRHLVQLNIKGFRIAQLHVIGFSLGAHVAAYASNHLQKHFKKKFGRITGLDPALPFFASLKNRWKLDKEDASFVDIIHTNSGIFGKIEPTGHVDFYVNGGIIQPACRDAHNPPLCSHVIATVYFAESILAKDSSIVHQFRGEPCTNFLDFVLGQCEKIPSSAIMGESCSPKTRGIYHVSTGTSPPFAKG